MQATRAKPETLHLPVFVAEAAATQQNILQKIDKECKLVLEGKSQEISVASLKDLNKTIAEARKTETVMNHMLVTMNKLV